ncbi:MAG: hypothetical protein ABFC77_11385, partial [Thermoguttaceae bacterium]
ATMFAIAAAWACLLRRPVLGGMAAIGSFMMVNIGMEWWETTRRFDPIDVYNNLTGGSIDFTSQGYPVAATGLAVILLASTLVAGLTLRRYVPQRQGG